MKKISFLIAALFLLNINLKAQNEQNIENLGYHQHDGFYFSLSLASGVLDISGKTSEFTTEKLNLDGTGGGLDIKIGGAIKENVILHANLTSTSFARADIEIDNEKTELGNNDLAGVLILGGGFTFYVMPYNIFFSVNYGLASCIMELKDDKFINNEGFGLDFKVGKEWWVSKNWGLGVSLNYNYTSFDENKNDYNNYNSLGKITSNFFGISLNATFN